MGSCGAIVVNPGEAVAPGLEQEVCTWERWLHLGGLLKVELTALGNGKEEERAGSRLWVAPGVVGPEHLVMQR